MEQNSVLWSLDSQMGYFCLLRFSYFLIISIYSDLTKKAHNFLLLPSNNLCFALLSQEQHKTNIKKKAKNMNCTKHLQETYRKSALMLLIKEHVENRTIALQKYYTYKSLKNKQSQMQLIHFQLCLMCEAGAFCA